MSPLAALGLIKYVPDLIGLFDKKRGDKARVIAERVGDIAEGLTGKQGGDVEKALAANPDLAYRFQLAVMSDKHVKTQMEMADRANARAMHKINPEQANKVAEQIMRYNLVLVFLLVVINVLSVMYLADNGPVIAIISNFIGIAMHALLNERQSVTAFYFGSSMGSKMKSVEGDKDGRPT